MTVQHQTKSEKKQRIRVGKTADRPYWVMMSTIVIRAFHQLGAAVFLAAFILKDDPVIPGFYLLLAVITGFLLLLTEGMRHRWILREACGVSTLFKLLVLGLVYHRIIPAFGPMVFVFLTASFFSHAPRTIRHRLLF